MNRKQKAIEERYKSQSSRGSRTSRSLPPWTEPECDIEYIVKTVKEAQEYEKAGYWSFEVPDEWLPKRDRQYKELQRLVKDKIDYTQDYWQQLEQLMVREWKARNSKLAKALR